ncbi:ATP-binding protein, partial [Streptomyces sp. NPDC059558]|uniref:ATP-binding protein n=1 Tax=Streptomyces sp. NPDC059558 TaxID=3346864 RepID=UPI0036CA21FB
MTTVTDMVERARTSRVLDVPATVAALGSIASFVLRLAGAAGLDKGATYRLRLAVDELATNVVMHGYRGGDGRITVRGRSGPDGVQIVIEDSAPPFDPVEGPPPPPPPGAPPPPRGGSTPIDRAGVPPPPRGLRVGAPAAGGDVTHPSCLRCGPMGGV